MTDGCRPGVRGCPPKFLRARAFIGRWSPSSKGGVSVDLELAAPETVYRVLSEDGSELVSDPPEISDADLVAVMAEMVKARVPSDRFSSLQRQARAGTSAPIEGQEAPVVGTAAALDPAR